MALLILRHRYNVAACTVGPNQVRYIVVKSLTRVYDIARSFDAEA